MASHQNLLPLALLLLAASAAAQNCGCPSNLCCSQFGYCGTSHDYCGSSCQQNCQAGGNSSSSGVASVVTDAFFNSIIGQAVDTCAGKNFYTRSAFISAVKSYPSFGSTGSSDDQKREIAAFFAHVTHETGSFCLIEEINGASKNYCDASNTQYPCNPNKAYFGRGPLQITWNYNYGPAGQSIGIDYLNYPETVSNDATIAFKTALWFWMYNVHSIITSGQGFGATIQVINNIECNRGNTGKMNDRVSLYTKYCKQLGVDANCGQGCLHSCQAGGSSSSSVVTNTDPLVWCFN